VRLGQVGPEIEGTDVDGKPMTLGEHRGKVVVLSFWGSWCGPCMALVPHERELAARLADRPFVLLGINSDEDRGRARQVMDRERMTWRSWWDGPPTDRSPKNGRPALAHPVCARPEGRDPLQGPWRRGFRRPRSRPS
jgi:thiol-disulfide isomerase/thioredoxin